MTQKISRELTLLTQGGFETRPYKSPDLCAASICQHSKLPASRSAVLEIRAPRRL